MIFGLPLLRFTCRDGQDSPHNPKVPGSNPGPATKQDQRVTRFPRNPFFVENGQRAHNAPKFSSDLLVKSHSCSRIIRLPCCEGLGLISRSHKTRGPPRRLEHLFEERSDGRRLVELVKNIAHPSRKKSRGNILGPRPGGSPLSVPPPPHQACPTFTGKTRTSSFQAAASPWP